jgi:hypothetical protein
VIALLAGVAFAQSVQPPISEVDHPRYVDATGAPLTWAEVRSMAAGSEAMALVHRRQVGRNLVRAMFVGATALEAWGTVELAQRGRWTSYALGAQTGLTGLCAVLSFTNAPTAWAEDRALLVNGVNAATVGRR